MPGVKQTARQKANKYGLKPSTFVRQIGAESGFNPKAVSLAGARGAAQIMPDTAKAWGVNIYDNRYDDDLDAAAKHMAEYVKQFGSYRAALVAYNAGPGAVGKPLPAETVNYISKILGGRRGQTAVATGTSYLPATSKVDESGAAIDALLSHAASPGTSLLQSLVRNLDSGLYTTSAPAVRSTYNLPPQAADGHGVALPGGGSVQQLIQRADKIDSEHLPYKWGGGHGPTPAKPGVPVDCSGAVARLFGVNPRVSGEFAKWGASGRGKHVTIWANPTHVLVEINGHFWGTSASNPGGGAGWIPRGVINTKYLSRFTPRHPG